MIKKKIIRYLLLVVSLFLAAINFNLFISPIKLVAGGSNGIAVILHHLCGFNPSFIVLIVSTILLLLSVFILGIDKSFGTIIATFLYPLFLELTIPITNRILIDSSDLLLLTVFAAIISGITTGLAFKVGFNTGGLSILYQILYKAFKIPISTSNFLINCIIVIIGGTYFGWTNVFYAIIYLYINSLIINKVLLGISNNKYLYIITSKEELVKKYLIGELGQSITIFNTEGSRNKNNVLMTALPTINYYAVSEKIKDIDHNVFLVVTDAYQVNKHGKDILKYSRHIN